MPIITESSGSPIITEGELASYLQRDIPEGKAALVVSLANGLVEDVIGALNPTPVRVKTITLEVAARGYRNPESYSSEQTSIDDYDKIVRREGPALTEPGIYLTEDEEAELLAILSAATSGTPAPRRRVGSIRLRVPRVP